MNVFEMWLKILSYHGICDKEANKRNEQLDSVLKGDGQRGGGTKMEKVVHVCLSDKGDNSVKRKMM